MAGNKDNLSIGIQVTGADQAAAEVDRVTDAEQQLEQRVGQSGQATSKAAGQRRSLSDRSRELYNRMTELTQAQQRHGAALKSGQPLSEDARASAQRRERQIQRLGRALGQYQDQQARANAQVRDSINAHRRYDDSGQAVERRSRSMGRTTQGLSQQLNAATFGIGGMVTGMMGASGLVAALQASDRAAEQTIERLEKIVELTNEAAKATLDLHAINLGFNQGDEELISSFSTATGRPFEESAKVITGFRSSTAALTREQQDELINNTLLPLALTTGGSIDPFAKFIGRASATTQDPKELNNLVLQSISLAGESDPAQFLGEAGQLLISGNAAGLDNAETLGLLAFGSSKLETSVARNQLRNVFKKLGSDPSAQEKLSGLGVDTSGGVLSSIRQLSERETKPEEIIDLVGLENSDILQTLVAEFDTAESFIDQNKQAIEGDDLARQFIEDLVSQSPQHARALQVAQQDQQIQSQERQDPNAQVVLLARNAIELQLEQAVQRGDLTASAKEARLKAFDSVIGRPNAGASARSRLGEDFRERERLGQLDPGEDDPRLRTGEVTIEEIVEAAAGTIESGGLLSDLLPGGDQSTEIELSNFVRNEVGRGPALPGRRGAQGGQTVIQKQVNVYGTVINNSGDPTNGDDFRPDGEVP